MFNKQTGEVTLPASQGEGALVADGVLTSDHSGAKQPETGYESSQKGETPQPALRKRKVKQLPSKVDQAPHSIGTPLKEEDPLIITLHMIPSLFLMARHLSGSSFCNFCRLKVTG